MCYYVGTQVFSPGLSGLEFEKKKILCLFELCLNTQLSAFLLLRKNQRAVVKTQQQAPRCVLSSFQGRVEPLNYIIVLILKHYCVSIGSRQMKCTLL